MNRVYVLATVLAAALGVPSVAAAAGTLSLDAPCYYTGQTIAATGQGFPAAAPIAISDPIRSLFSASTTSDTTGTFNTTFIAPRLSSSKPAVKKFTATATDTNDPTQTASTTFYDVQPGVDANVNGRLSTPVEWTIAGFAGGQTVYGHWVFKNKSRKTLTMGDVPGACGLVQRTVKRLPTVARTGIWTAQFDTKKTWSATTKPRVYLKIQVFTRVKVG